MIHKVPNKLENDIIKKGEDKIETDDLTNLVLIN